MVLYFSTYQQSLHAILESGSLFCTDFKDQQVHTFVSFKKLN